MIAFTVKDMIVIEYVFTDGFCIGAQSFFFLLLSEFGDHQVIWGAIGEEREGTCSSKQKKGSASQFFLWDQSRCEFKKRVDVFWSNVGGS